MLKLAQLETIAELQQAEIHTLKDEVQANKREIRKLKGENVTENATDASMSQLKQDSKVKEAQEVFQHVVKKHLHQRSQRKFVTPYSRRKKVSKSKEKKESSMSLLYMMIMVMLHVILIINISKLLNN